MSEQLTSKQQQAVLCLMAHSTIAGAAQAAGISERTLRNWLADDTFNAAYRQAQSVSMGQSLDTLLGAAHKAIETLLDLLNSPRDTVRLQAARVLLEQSLVGYEKRILTERIEAIEKAQQQ